MSNNPENSNVKISKLKKILVPLDGSDNSKRALIEAISLAKISDAKITGIYVISSEQGMGSFVDALKPLSTLEEENYAGKQLSEANGIMGEAKNVCKKYPVEFNGIAANGIPGNKIIQYAQDNDFDHIVIGISGKGHIGEVLLGSVSDYVIHHANVPVTIVK